MYLLTSIIFTLIYLLSPSEVHAQSLFDTQIKAQYVVDTHGTTQVTQHITLTNRQATQYATQYRLILVSDRISDLQVVSADGQNIPFNLDQTNYQTQINILFNDPVVGAGRSRHFYINYTDRSVSQLYGSILEIFIPKLFNYRDIADYQVSISVPANFSNPSSVSPTDYLIEHDATLTILSFSGDDAKSQGISVIFGTRQTYDTNLHYHLSNPGITPIDTQVAFPPDTLYQKVFIDSIQPPPARIELDPDGNWLATYHLEAKTDLSISYQGQIQVFLHPLLDYPPYFQSLDTYLVKQPYWPVTDPAIESIAVKHLSAQDIYNFTVDTLDYDRLPPSERLSQRQGANHALANPSKSLCLEYADLFITLARAAGIPARLHLGYAYTTNSLSKPLSLNGDSLHAWPDYFNYSLNRWQPVDPTWGDTTGGNDYFHQFDANHITFALRGLSSELPYPAGYYPSNQPKDTPIEIVISELTPIASTIFSSTISKTPFNLFHPGINYRINLFNRSNIAWYNLPVDLKLDQGVVKPGRFHLEVFLPYSQTHQAISVESSSLKSKLSVHINDQQEVHDLTFRSDILSSLSVLAPAAAVVCLVAFIAIGLRRLLVSRSK